MDRQVQEGVREVYSEKRRREAVDLWFELYGEMSVDSFVAELGYPCRETMLRWIKADPRHDPDKPRYDSQPVLTKLQAVKRVAEGATRAQAVRESGLTPSAVGRAVDRYAAGGTAALLPGWKGKGVAGRKRGEGRRPAPVMQGPPGVPSELPDDPAALKAIVRELQMDNALLGEVPGVLKADPGCDPADLTSAERAAAVASLEGRFPLGALRERMGIAKSTCYYSLELLTRPDAPDPLGDAVEEEFLAEHGSRGYRVVWERLRRRPEPLRVSEKRVRAKMRERGLRPCGAGRRRPYSSYAGETDGRPANLPLRAGGTHDFSAAAPTGCGSAT